MEEYLHRFAADFTELQAQVVPDEEHGGFRLICPGRLGGARKETLIDFESFDSPELTELLRLHEKLKKYGAGPFTLADGNTRHQVAQIEQVLALQFKRKARRSGTVTDQDMHGEHAVTFGGGIR